MGKNLVFVIEDEQDIAELIRFNLETQDFEVQTFLSGEVGLKSCQEQKPDLVILDLMLPGISGLEICQSLRSAESTLNLPIIMVTAKGSEDEIIQGLEIGADDYITKPFSVKILISRVKTVLRRRNLQLVSDTNKIQREQLVIYPERHEVFVEGNKVDLTQSEFKILEFLIKKPGWVFTRGQIVDEIRGVGYAVTDRAIDFQMVGLRKKLGSQGVLIETVRGIGYRFKDEVD